MTVIPVFPLSITLLPAMPLSLRIFEERYLKLLGDLLTSETPEFGVVLVESGEEVGGGEERFSLGTMAFIYDIGVVDEHYGIQAIGTKRFRVNAWLPDNPYPMADVEFLPDLEWDESLLPTQESVETRLRQLLATLTEFGTVAHPADFKIIEDRVFACWQLIMAMPIVPSSQAEFLHHHSAKELLEEAEKVVLEVEQALIDLLKEQGEQGGSIPQ